MAADVAKLTEVKMIESTSVTINMSGKTVMVNNATVTSADIAASNGVILVIDTLLRPSAN